MHFSQYNIIEEESSMKKELVVNVAILCLCFIVLSVFWSTLGFVNTAEAKEPGECRLLYTLCDPPVYYCYDVPGSPACAPCGSGC